MAPRIVIIVAAGAALALSGWRPLASWVAENAVVSAGARPVPVDVTADPFGRGSTSAMRPVAGSIKVVVTGDAPVVDAMRSSSTGDDASLAASSSGGVPKPSSSPVAGRAPIYGVDDGLSAANGAGGASSSSSQSDYQPHLPPQVYDPVGRAAMQINARVDLGFRYDPAAQGSTLRLQNASAEPFTVSFHGDVAGVTIDGQAVTPNQPYTVRAEAEVTATAAVSVHIRGTGPADRTASPTGNG